jgi:hypothetical protein
MIESDRESRWVFRPKNSLNHSMKNGSIEINLSEKYDLTGIDGMTIHTLLTALADAERMYKKVGMAGLAENAANAYKMILASIETAGEDA